MIRRLFGASSSTNADTEGSPNPNECKEKGNPTYDVERLPATLYTVHTLEDGSPQQECMYITCEAFVRPSAARYSFELVIVRTDDDDDDEGGDNEANKTNLSPEAEPTTPPSSSSAPNSTTRPPSDVNFPIDKSAHFLNEDRQFSWFDPSGTKYMLDLDDEASATQLRRAISVALFQKIHSALPKSEEDEKEVDQLLTNPPDPTSDDLIASKGELIRATASFLKFDMDKGDFFNMLPSVIVTINSAVVKEDNTRAYLMVIYHPQTGQLVFEVEITNSINSQFFSNNNRLVWFVSLDPNIDVTEALENSELSHHLAAMGLEFEEDKEFVRFRNQYTVCLYEVSNNASISDLKVKDDDLDYIQNSARDDVDPMEIDEPSDTEVAEEEELERRQVQDTRHRASLGVPGDGLKNSQLAIATNHDRTFVVRGNKMGVFQTGDDGAEWRTTIDFVNPTDKSSFTPSKVLLHRMDNSMLLLDPENESRIMRMDLERGDVVDTWQGGLTKNTPIKSVHQTNKYSNMTDEQEFIGLNRNQLLRLDPRTQEFFVQSKKYAAATRARLECVATTGSGYLATASQNGDIRMFDQVGKNAKTHLPGLGDPILGIDVTENGHFILATTETYLLLIDTRVKGQAKGGFEKSMGKNKPIPRKLTIKNEDIVKYRMGKIQFTTAHFNTGSSLERSIVTSTGPFIVIWNFRQVKLGKLDSYKIKRYSDNVVADNFTYNNDGRIVVTLPNDVSVAKR